MSTSGKASPRKLTGKQLDRLLEAANSEIRQLIAAQDSSIGAQPSSSRGLAEIMTRNTGSAPAIQGATAAGGPGARQHRAALTIAMRSLARELAVDLGDVAEFAADLARAALTCHTDPAFADQLALLLARDRTAPARKLAALTRDLAALTRDLADLAIARDLADLDLVPGSDTPRRLAMTIARDLAGLDPVSGSDWRVFSAPVAVLGRALESLRELIVSIGSQQVDASGADLSGVSIDHLDSLNGTTWTDQTIWPPHIKDQVRANSEKIGHGVYQVRPGAEPDRSSLVSV